MNPLRASYLMIPNSYHAQEHNSYQEICFKTKLKRKNSNTSHELVFTLCAIPFPLLHPLTIHSSMQTFIEYLLYLYKEETLQML